MPPREIVRSVVAIVERLGLPAMLLDSGGRIVHANRAIAQRRDGDLVGRLLSDAVHPDDCAQFAACLARVLEGGADRCRVRVAFSGGAFHWFSVHLSTIDAEQGDSAVVLVTLIEARDDSAVEIALRRERRTLMRLLESHDYDRRMIGYDLHDGAAQLIAGAILKLDAFRKLNRTEPKRAEEAVLAAHGLLALARDEIRRLISGVRPLVLDEKGIAAAVARMIEEQAIDGRPHIELRARLRGGRLPTLVENAAYRIIQESLHNAVRYSGAERVLVSLRQSDRRLYIIVRDWGTGFNPSQIRSRSFGLEGMRERARVLGGRCRIHSAPGRGTRVIAQFPLPEPPMEPDER